MVAPKCGARPNCMYVCMYVCMYIASYSALIVYLSKHVPNAGHKSNIQSISIQCCIVSDSYVYFLATGFLTFPFLKLLPLRGELVTWKGNDITRKLHHEL